jgi:hypothetical protein
LGLSLISTPNAPCGTTVSQCSSGLAGGQIGGVLNVGNTGPGTSIAGLFGFTPVNGTFTAYYAVTNDANGASLDTTGSFNPAIPTGSPQFSTITLYEVVPTQNLTLPNAAPTVTVSLVGTTAPFYAEFATPATATAKAAAASAVFVPPASGTGFLTACNTTLLFPYVVNLGNYDTGFEITNASLGTTIPGNTVTLTASGVCSIQFWGATSFINQTPAGLPVNSFTITANVSAGQVWAQNLSTVLGGGAPGAATGSGQAATPDNFVGYAVASCNFQQAHGLAIISDQFGANPGRGLSEAVPAVVLGDVYGGTFVTVNAPF